MANPLNQIFPAYCAKSLKTFLLKHAFTVETGMSSRIVRGLYAEVGFIPPQSKNIYDLLLVKLKANCRLFPGLFIVA